MIEELAHVKNRTILWIMLLCRHAGPHAPLAPTTPRTPAMWGRATAAELGKSSTFGCHIWGSRSEMKDAWYKSGYVLYCPYVHGYSWIKKNTWLQKEATASNCHRHGYFSWLTDKYEIYLQNEYLRCKLYTWPHLVSFALFRNTTTVRTVVQTPQPLAFITSFFLLSIPPSLFYVSPFFSSLS